jgi:NitT/TauT family transport system substrate-binding protein
MMGRVCWLVIALALVSCHRQQAGANVTKIRLAIHREPIAFLPMRVAGALGYYQAEGIAVDTSDVAGGTKAIEALLGGSVDVAAASMSDVMLVAAEGRDLRGFFVVYTRPSAAVAVAPAQSTVIRTIRDLKGRTVGVSAPGSWTHQFLNFLLASNGLSPQDVSTVSVGMSASSVAALEHGTVDAAVLLAGAISTFEGRHPASTFMADTRTLDGVRKAFGTDTFPSLGLVARETWLRDHGEIARRLVRAVRRGMRWVGDHPAEQVRDMVPQDGRMALDADLESIRQIQQALSLDGRMPPDSPALIQKFVAFSNARVRAADIDAARFYTNEFAAAK